MVLDPNSNGIVMGVDILILNYNGRPLLADCLPSVVAAAEASKYRCKVTVIDNDSSDDSVAWLSKQFAMVRVVPHPNRGLCSFNDVIPHCEGSVVLLLNNDIKLDRLAIDPLVEPLLNPTDESETRYYMTAPRCCLFDETTYEGFRTAVGWRRGLVQATALFAGHEASINRPGFTASAGAALAVRREVFVELGGFDPVYLPGRLEDLDFCFRAWQAGYTARYVPESLVYHRGAATFGTVYGTEGCHQLALRNTLLFQWKNLRHPAHRLRSWLTVPIRLAADLLRAPMMPSSRRFAFARAWLEARRRWQEGRSLRYCTGGTLRRERAFFEQFSPRKMMLEGGEAC